MSNKDPLRWMPWDVPDWFMSTARAEMCPCARSGYFELLCADWYEDGLVRDSYQLRIKSGLSSAEWQRHKDVILKHFVLEEDGKLHNPRALAEKAKALNKLRGDQHRTRAARIALLQKRKAEREALCNSPVTDTTQSSVTMGTETKTKRETKTPPIPTTPKKEEKEDISFTSPEDDDPPSLYPRKPATPSTDRRTIGFQRVGELLPAILNRLDLDGGAK